MLATDSCAHTTPAGMQQERVRQEGLTDGGGPCVDGIVRHGVPVGLLRLVHERHGDGEGREHLAVDELQDELAARVLHLAGLEQLVHLDLGQEAALQEAQHVLRQRSIVSFGIV